MLIKSVPGPLTVRPVAPAIEPLPLKLKLLLPETVTAVG
jgi:hypothetical protein